MAVIITIYWERKYYDRDRVITRTKRRFTAI